MEAVVRISGKQFRVTEGQRLEVPRLSTPAGATATFTEVLLVSDKNRATIGSPVVEGASVTARVLAETRGEKINVYKYKAKKRYRRSRGSRADYSLLEVTAVTAKASAGTGAKEA